MWDGLKRMLKGHGASTFFRKRWLNKDAGPLIGEEVAGGSGEAAPGRSRRQSETLLEMQDALSKASNLDEVLDLLLEITGKEVSANRMTLFLNDEAKGELFSRSSVGGLRDEIRIPNTSGIVGHVFTTGEAVIIDDAYADARFNQEVDRNTGYRTETLLCVAIHEMSGRIIGAAQALNSTKGAFDARDQAYLEAIAERAAGILRQSQYAERVNPQFLRFFGQWFRKLFSE